MKTNNFDESQQNTVPMLKDGLPRQAFAIVEDPEFPSTWHLPHHTPQIMQSILGHCSPESTVDWALMGKAIVMLSRPCIDGHCITSDKYLLLEATRHLLNHYHTAHRPIPNALRICLIMFGLER